MDRRRVLVVKNMMFFFIISLFNNPSLKLLKAQIVRSLYVFGDSQVDVGNNNHLLLSIAKSNFAHHGVDFLHGKATGRFSNGKNAADFLAEKLGLPSSPAYLSLSSKSYASYKNGVSFASGGSGILDGTDRVFGQAMPLSEQVDNFLAVHKVMLQKMGSSGVEKHFSKSLVAIVSGSNDILDYFDNEDEKSNTMITPQKLVDLMINQLKSQIKRVYESGARKFLVSGVGALGCVPAERAKNKTHECNEEINFVAVKFNEGVKEVLKGLKSELQDLKYSFFDLYGTVQNVIQNPSAHGFKEIKAACCGLGELRTTIPCLPFSLYCPNRKDHIFWDLYHPTEAMARIVADTLFDGPSKYCVPMNVRQLVSSTSLRRKSPNRRQMNKGSSHTKAHGK